VDTALGLLGVLLFIICVLALSAGVSFAVIRVDGLIRKMRGKAPAGV
jgi:hypothetical protein